MAKKRRPNTRPENTPGPVSEDVSAASDGIDIPVPEDAAPRPSSRRGRARRTEDAAAHEADLLPETSAPAGTVYTLGSPNEFGEFEDVSFDGESAAPAAPADGPRPEAGAALDISDIPNAVPEARPDGAKPSSRKGRGKRRPARPAAGKAASDAVPDGGADPAEKAPSDGDARPNADAPPDPDASRGIAAGADISHAAPDGPDVPHGEPSDGSASGGAESAPEAPSPAPKKKANHRRKKSPSAPDASHDKAAVADIPRAAPDGPDAPHGEPSDGTASGGAESAPEAPSPAPEKKPNRRRKKPQAAPDASQDTAVGADIPHGASDDPDAPHGEPSDRSPDASPASAGGPKAKKAKKSGKPSGSGKPSKPEKDRASVPKLGEAAPGLILRGVLTENPLLVCAVGVFPAAAAASTGVSALAAGVCALAALLVTNLAASLIGGRLPRRLRAALLMLLAACVSAGEELALAALLPDVSASLDMFTPLIAVCGLTLSRERFAAENSPAAALVDAAACGAGFTAALTLFGVLRELAGSCTVFGMDISAGAVTPALIFSAPAGGLLLLGLLSGAAKYFLDKSKRRTSKRGGGEGGL